MSFDPCHVFFYTTNKSNYSIFFFSSSLYHAPLNVYHPLSSVPSHPFIPPVHSIFSLSLSLSLSLFSTFTPRNSATLIFSKLSFLHPTHFPPSTQRFNFHPKHFPPFGILSSFHPPYFPSFHPTYSHPSTQHTLIPPPTILPSPPSPSNPTTIPSPNCPLHPLRGINTR